MSDKIKLGYYRHYKGNFYQVLNIAQHSESKELMVIYRALYGEFGLWVRPLTMFCETVEIEGKTLPRFEFLKPLSDLEYKS